MRLWRERERERERKREREKERDRESVNGPTWKLDSYLIPLRGSLVITLLTKKFCRLIMGRIEEQIATFKEGESV